MPNKKTAAALLCAAMILLAGCSTPAAQGGPGQTPAPAVTLEEARETALADAGLTREQVVFTEAKPDTEDGLSVYEFEFHAGGTGYSYEVNAQTGAVYSKSMVIYMTPAPEAPVPEATREPGPEATPEAAQAPAPTPQPTQTPAPTATPAPAPTAAPAPAPTATPAPVQAYIGLDAAKSAALADAGTDAAQVSFTKVEFDWEDGVPVYEIEFCTSTHEYEYEIHAHTGAVCHRSAEACSVSGGHHGSGHHSDPHLNGGSCIGVDPAKRAALGHAGCSAGQVRFTKAELDYEDGRAVYEIEFIKDGMEYEYTIDAATGDVLEYDWELD